MKNKKLDGSILRDEEYKALSQINLNGNILDLGGSTKSGYHSLLGGKHSITTVNLNPEYGCDLVFDIQKKFPLEDRAFDGILCLNVLEHIYGVQNVLSESSRVLKDGGTAVFATPFMFHVHGSPDDYFRFTKSALSQMFIENGFIDVKIKEMGYGLFSVIFQTIEPALPQLFRSGVKRFFVHVDKVLLRFVPKYRKLSNRIPLGYFLIARK